MVSDLPLESLSDEALVEEMIIDFKIKSTMLPTNLKNRNPMNITDLEKFFDSFDCKPIYLEI